MSVFESFERQPVEYLPTGDKALLMAWALVAPPTQYGMPEARAEVVAVLCLEDGRAVQASLSEFKFDYRYSNAEQAWYDVSKIFEGEEGPDGDTDQEDADHGGEEVPG